MSLRIHRIPPAAAILVLTALFFAAMFLLTPPSTDDIWYLFRSMDRWMAGQPLGFPLDRIFEEIEWRYANDNARLSNVVFAFLAYAPRWVVASLSAAACALALFSLAQLSGLTGRDWRGSVWLCALFSMALPWVEHLFTGCYSLNYVWPMGFFAWLALRILRGSPLPVWLAAVAGLLGGAWHEGFSAPVLVGVGALALFCGRRFRARWIIALIVGLAAGCLWLYFAPSFFSRSSGGMSGLLSLSVWFQVLKADFLFVLFCLLCAVAACRPTSRHCLRSPLVIFVGAAGFVSVGIHLFALFGLRVGLCAEVFAIPAIFFLWPRCFSLHGRVGTLLTALLGLFLFAHLSLACVCAFRLDKQFRRIYSQYRTSPDGHIFIDLTPDFEAPFLALGKPLFLHMESCLAVHFTAPAVEKPMLPVPSELAQVDSTAGEDAPGRPGLRRLGNRFFIPADSVGMARESWTKVRGRVLFGTRPHERSLVFVPFVSRADSLPYFYIYIEDRMPLGRFVPVEGMDW